MIDHCKFCEIEIPIPQLGRDFWCIHCRHYSIVFDFWGEGLIESENLRVGNYYLHFFPAHKEANVVEARKEDDHRIINTFAMNELTHELAVQWVKKLKTYVVFQ